MKVLRRTTVNIKTKKCKFVGHAAQSDIWNSCYSGILVVVGAGIKNASSFAPVASKATSKGAMAATKCALCWLVAPADAKII